MTDQGFDPEAISWERVDVTCTRDDCVNAHVRITLEVPAGCAVYCGPCGSLLESVRHA